VRETASKSPIREGGCGRSSGRDKIHPEGSCGDNVVVGGFAGDVMGETENLGTGSSGRRVLSPFQPRALKGGNNRDTYSAAIHSPHHRLDMGARDGTGGSRTPFGRNPFGDVDELLRDQEFQPQTLPYGVGNQERTPSDAAVGGGAPLALQVGIADEGGSDSDFMPLPLRSRSVQRGARLVRRGRARDSALTGRQSRAGPRGNRVVGSTKDVMSAQHLRAHCSSGCKTHSGAGTITTV